MLGPYRVLDLTDERAALGPMMLADLGADVILVEPPGGSPARRSPPLDPDQPEDMASLRFHAFNRNKRSVTLDLDCEADRAAFLDLVRSADFLFENAAPGAMSARGLGYDDLRAVNPHLVYVAITPYGQDGPHAGFAAADLTLAAMGGMAAVNGDADRPPVRISAPQTWLHAAAESALAALVAHNLRLQTGEGQFVDVSVQAATFWTTLNAGIATAIQGFDFERNGSMMQLSTATFRTMYPCTDGNIVVFINPQSLKVFVPWMAEDGIVPESWVTDEDWATYDVRMLTGQPLTHPLDELTERIAAYTINHAKRELFERGHAAGMFLAPSNTVEDVLAFQHLEARGYWQPLELPDGSTLRLPGPFVRAERTPITYRRGTPRAGEHTEEVLNQLGEPAVPHGGSGGAAPESVADFAKGAPGRGPGESVADFPRRGGAGVSATLPLAGLKVADFSWIGVGPITAKYFADHGATTVRIETSKPVDRLRVAGPFKDGVFGHNRSQFFGAFNTSKLSLSLDLKHPEGQAIARRLIAWADVYFESFTAGTVADLGLDYATAKAINPGIIMVSSCLMGQSGPAAPLAGYGTHAAAVSGFSDLTGWPDRLPAGPFQAYTDTIAPRFLATTVMAALDHRWRTGKGQYIEQAQMESALYFLAPELLEYQVNGTVAGRMGNASRDAAPHGIYPCKGDNQWCAIAVESDEQWRSLRRALGEPAWSADSALDSTAGRLAAREALDERLSRWTRSLEPALVMQTLQAAGVPAGVVQRSSDLLRDPQLAHRNFFRPLQHAEMGEVPYEGHQFRIRGYDSGPRLPAPCLGEHSLEVLRDLLSMTDDEVAAAVAGGALV
jgi:crotonobetainyl-CoA:carnitine CoA-transferase CaiB-like acyl-CoA transferase